MRRLLFGALALLLGTLPAAAQTFNLRSSISASSSGDNTVIAAVSGKQIAIYALDLSLASGTTVTLKCGSTSLTGAMTLRAYSKSLLLPAPPYWVCAANTAFVINLGSGVQASGAVWYTQQ